MSLRDAIPHLAASAVIAGCAWLALWQVERAGEKRAIMERWHERSPVSLASIARPFDLPQPIVGVGIWDASRQILLDNRVRDHRPGVQVLTPMSTHDGRLFLVNRGWAEWRSRTAPLPDPGLPSVPSPIQGVLNTPPGTGLRLGEVDIDDSGKWPVLATYFDHDALAALFGEKLQPAVIQLDPDHPAHLTGDRWQVVTFGPDRHIGYAMTWTSIALVVAGLWVVLTIRQVRGRKR